MRETSTVSFCRPMKSFRSGGITRRTACGRITKRIDCAAREPERPGGRHLARVHRLDPRPVDLRDVRRIDEHERRRPPRRTGSRARPGSRAPAPRTRAGRSRGSWGCRGTGRCRSPRAGGSGRRPGPGKLRITAITSAKARIKTSASMKSRTFTRNARTMPGKRVLELRAVEERALHLVPARRVHDDQRQHDEEHDRADHGDRDAPSALGPQGREQLRPAVAVGEPRIPGLVLVQLPRRGHGLAPPARYLSTG